MTTQTIKITDAVIKKALANSDIRQLKDPRYSLYFRINSNRTGGSWTYVHYLRGKQKRRKIATYPAVKSNELFGMLSKIVSSIDSGGAIKVGYVLEWYLESQINKHKSYSRKVGVRSLINKYFYPALQDVFVNDLSIELIKDKLITPNNHLSKGTMKTLFSQLKAILSAAEGSKQINCMSPLKRTCFSELIPCEKQENGYIYAVTNPCFVGLVKVGLTNLTPKARLKSLYSSSVPAPFEMYRYVNVKDASKAESFAHDLLSTCRFNPDREFFKPQGLKIIDDVFDLIEVKYGLKDE